MEKICRYRWTVTVRLDIGGKELGLTSHEVNITPCILRARAIVLAKEYVEVNSVVFTQILLLN